MEEYRSNSMHARETKEESTIERKLTPVVSNEAVAQKKSGFGKVVGSIIATNAEEMGTWVVADVIVPWIKKGIFDLVTNGIDMLLYGKTSSKSSSTVSKVSYGNYYSGRVSNEPSRVSSGGSGFDYDTIVFRT